MDGAPPAPETESNAAPDTEKNPVDVAWAKLYSAADEMLRSYKKVLEFYSKWLSNLFPYWPLVQVYKAHRVWKAVDTLNAMEDQSEMLLELGAAESLLDAAAELRPMVIEKPTTLLAKRSFAENILLIAEKLVVDNPKQKYPVDEVPCRRNVKGSFTRCAEETHRCMKDAVKRCDIFLRMTTPNDDETDSDDDGDSSSGDETPKHRNGNAPFNTEPPICHPAESSVRSTVGTPHVTRVTFDDSARVALARASSSAATKILVDAEHRHSDDKLPCLDLTESGNVPDCEDDCPDSQLGDDRVNDEECVTPRAPSPAYSCEDEPETPLPKGNRDIMHLLFDALPGERPNPLDGENDSGDPEHLDDGTYPRRIQNAEKRRFRAMFAALEGCCFPDSAYKDLDDDDDEGDDEGGRRVRK